MHGAMSPLTQYAFMVWCLVKAQGQLYLYLYINRRTIGRYIIMVKMDDGSGGTCKEADVVYFKVKSQRSKTGIRTLYLPNRTFNTLPPC